MRPIIARLAPYIEAGSGVLLWQILISISAGVFFRLLRCFSDEAAMGPIDPEDPQGSDGGNG